MSRIGMSAILVVVFAAFVVSAILHDDEVGQRDWKYSGIGRVELAAFVTTPSVKQTIVASEEGFVAALSTLDKGDIRWRHSLGEAQVCLSADASGTLVTSARGVGHLLETSTGQLTAAFSVDLTGLTNGRVTDCFYSGASRTINVVAVGGTTVRVYSFKADYNALAGEPVVATHTFTVSSAATNAKVAGLVNVWVERNGTGVDVWSFGSKEVTTTDTMGWLLETSTNGNIVMSFYKDNTSPKDPEAGHALRVMSAEGKVIKATDKGTACKECRSGFAKAEEADASGSLVITIREQPDTFALLVASRRFNVASKGNYPPRVIAARQTSKKADVLLRASNGHLLLVTATLDSDSAIVAWERFEGLSSPAHVKVAPLNDFSSKVDGVEVPSTNPSDVFGFNVDIIVLSTYGTLYRVPVASKGAEILVVADLTESVRKALDIVCICGITFKDLSIGDDGVATVVVQFKQETLVLTVGLTTGVITLASPPTLNALFLSSKAIVNADGVKVFGESVKAGSQYLYKVDRTTGKASGFKIPAGSSQSIPTWEVSFGPNIVAVAEPKDRLAVLSADHLRVFPNVTKINEVRRKYPTQNVAVVATVDDEDVLSVFIFDTLSGSILAVTRHNDVRGAVHAIIVEHVVVYHFLNADRMRYAVGVMELFEHEDVIVNEGTTASPALAVSSFFVSQKTFSPLTSRPPVVASMVLSFPAGAVRSLGVTSSVQGISRKQIIFALANGHVHAVDLRALCFGGQTNPAKPEEIIRHVNLPSVHIISHVYDVAQPRIVATTPTELESSSHVAVAGVDLLYVRVSAGKAFDMLNDDFNHRGLLLVCAALGVLSIVARYFAARKSLLLAWA